MSDCLTMAFMFICNGIGIYVAHKLFTWFETGRPHIEPQPRQNVRKEVKP